MSQIFLPGIIALLIIWLIFSIRKKMRLIIESEIYKHFPSIKNTIDAFEHRMNYLKAQVEVLERKIKEIEDKTKG